MMPRRTELCFQFMGEPLLAVLLTYLICTTFQSSVLSEFFKATVGDLLTILSQVMFPASVAVWISYVNIISGKFGDYIRHRGELEAFNWLFLVPIVVFAITSIALVFLRYSPGGFVATASLFLIVLSTLNLVTLVLNLTTIVRLYGAFRDELGKRGIEA